MNKEIDEQKEFMKKVAEENKGKNLEYIIITMGCQLKEKVREKIEDLKY